MASDTPKRVLSLKPAAPKPPTDPRAPRRPPVRPPGPARARPMSAARPPAPEPAPERPAAAAPAPKAPPREARPSAPRTAPKAPSRPAFKPGAAPRPVAGRPAAPRPTAPRAPAADPAEARARALAALGGSTTPPPAPPAAAREPLPPREGTRLNKRMAELGLCSRREADDWIGQGWVLVNGEVAQMGQPVRDDARIEILPEARESQGERVTILLHKTMGYVSGQPEDGHPAAVTLVQSRSRWKDDRGPRRFSPAQLKGLAPAGRLDIDSTGLLVLTQDGRVARALIGEDSGVEKEYLVRVVWAPNGPRAPGVVEQDVQSVFPADRLALLRHGLSLDEQPLKPAQVDWLNPEQLRFVLTEGKKRQIRRMCEAVGLHVVGLKRVRIGRILLGKLPPGQWRYLGEGEAF